MWFANEGEEQAIDRLLQELGIRLPEIKLGDNDMPELLLDMDTEHQQRPDEATEH